MYIFLLGDAGNSSFFGVIFQLKAREIRGDFYENLEVFWKFCQFSIIYFKI